MKSGREALIEAARTLLAAQPDREPSTRELYEAAGVAAPTLYHHFGTKDALLDVVVEEAFTDYLHAKRAAPRTGDHLVDFAAGWDLHVEFGVNNPVLYRLMFNGSTVATPAARAAEDVLRNRLAELAEAGLLRTDVEVALNATIAAAMGCVFQLHRTGGSPDDALARTLRDALLAELMGRRDADGPRGAAVALISWLGTAPTTFTDPEIALLRQWLREISTISSKGTNA